MLKIVILTATAVVLAMGGPAWALDAVDGSVRATPRPLPSTSSTRAVTMKVSNLPWAHTNEDLFKLVSEYGEVLMARIATDRETGRSRGFGYIEVSSVTAERILHELDGVEVAGRFLKFEIVDTRPNAERFPGRR